MAASRALSGTALLICPSLNPPMPPQGHLHFKLQVIALLGFPGGSDGKESACNAGDPGSIPGREDPVEKGMATHSSILAWRIPWQRSLMGYSPWGSQRFGHA